MNKEYAYEFLKSLSFERLSGSQEELKAAHMIMDEVKKLGLTAHLEEFPVDYSEIKKVSLQTFDPDMDFAVTGYKMSGSTPEEGVEGEFAYIGSGHDIYRNELEGKIVLVNGMTYKLYKQLIDFKVKAFINVSGSLYDDLAETDLNINQLRERHYQHGKIPGVTIRITDAEQLILTQPKRIKIILIQEESKQNSRNVITEIPGTKYPHEVIACTAHYDSVPFSTGAYDNGTGSITILALLAHFIKHPPLRTLRFIWCGSEEVGLLGSKAYVQNHEQELDTIQLCVNVDMTGVLIGRDIAVSTADQSLVSYIDYIAKEVGFPIYSSQGVYSSDSTPFADKGIPAVSFARMSTKGGVEFHSRRDVITSIHPDVMQKMTDFVIDFVTRMTNARYLPVPKTMPQNMKDELDKYLGRKE